MRCGSGIAGWAGSMADTQGSQSSSLDSASPKVYSGGAGGDRVPAHVHVLVEADSVK
jgi:hypothetical protein